MRVVRPLALALSLSLCTGLASAQAADGAPAARPALETPLADRRTPDQTYLTFPEWYLVHSPAEYARYLASGAPPSQFPLFSHIGQFWQGYRAVDGELGRYPFNGG